MTPAQIAKANDDLRQHFRGGRIEVCHGPYDLDDRTLGRLLLAVAKYNKFEKDSLHDNGVMIFAGFSICWRVETVDAERVLRVWLNGDVLQGT